MKNILKAVKIFAVKNGRLFVILAQKLYPLETSVQRFRTSSLLKHIQNNQNQVHFASKPIEKR